MSRTDERKKLTKITADSILFLINEQIDLLKQGMDFGDYGVGVDLSMWQGNLVIVPRFGRITPCEIQGGDLRTAGSAIRHLKKRSVDFREQFGTVLGQNDLVMRVVQNRDYMLLQHISY